MSLRDQLATDLSACFLSTADYGTACTVVAAGVADNSFSAACHIGDLSEEQKAAAWADTDLERHLATFLTATIRAGMLAQEGTARDLRPGDEITFPSAPLSNAAWVVVAPVVVDDGGATTATLERSARAIGRSADSVRS